MSKYRKLLPGDPAPIFRQRSTGGRVFDSCTARGRYNVLCFSSGHQMRQGKQRYTPSGTVGGFMTMQSFRSSASRSIRKTNAKWAESSSPMRYIWDSDGTVSRLFRAIPLDSMPGDGDYFARRFWLLLDPSLLVVALVPLAGNGSEQSELFAALDALPSLNLPEVATDPFTSGSWESAS